LADVRAVARGLILGPPRAQLDGFSGFINPDFGAWLVTDDGAAREAKIDLRGWWNT
jgi:hypothetical protein